MPMKVQQPHIPVDILLSTYNGSLYLVELIASLIGQTYSNWRLLIRDDGSTDNTVEIIQQYVSRFPNQVILLERGEANIGPCQSYARLMEFAAGDYLMFCDQDDVWLPNKIEMLLESMLQLEDSKPGRPLLVHSDLFVVDQALRPISPSFWQYQGLEPTRNHLKDLLVQNIATGCAMMINRRLLERALPIPKEAIMHDWWLTLVASIYTEVFHIDQATVLYRQHGHNTVGAIKHSIPTLVLRLGSAGESIERIIRQGEQLHRLHEAELNGEQQAILVRFINLLRENRLARIRTVRKIPLQKHGWLRQIGFYIVISSMKRRRGE